MAARRRPGHQVGAHEGDAPLTRADVEQATALYFERIPLRVKPPKAPGQGFAEWTTPDVYMAVTSDQTGIWVRVSGVTGGADRWDSWRLPEEWARSGLVPWKRAEAVAGRLTARKPPADPSVQLDLLEVAG